MDQILSEVGVELGLDPALALRRLLRRDNGQLVEGVIAEYMPHVCMYTVLVGNHGPVVAIPIHQTSSLMTFYGAKDISAYVPGSHVLVYLPNNGLGLILGSVPEPASTGNNVLPDAIVQAAQVGATDDELYLQVLRSDQAGGVFNYSSGRPIDQLAGDWGAINELGLAIMLGKFMAMLRASDDCGIWVFFMDRLLRLVGRNFELFTSGLEHRIFNDCNELHDVLAAAKYPWEALGLRERGNPFRQAGGKWQPGNDVSFYEPLKEDQAGIWRYMRMRGYLGDIKHEYVLLPPDVAVEQYSRKGPPYGNGLLEVVYGSDGFFGLRTARGFSLRKYVAIPAPKQLKPPDNEQNGDNPDNYKASGIDGSGDKPPKQSHFKWDEDKGDPAGQLREYLAYVWNWYVQQGLANHKQDWQLPEEVQSLLAGFVKAIYDGGLAKLKEAQHAAFPKKTKIKIDHRNEEGEYYQSEAGVDVLPDGSVVIQDGYGSQIVMSRGNIRITCPGDIQLMPGRSLIGWIPGDTVLRTGKYVDITSTSADVRVKAERNMHVLGGNAEGGGLLLESRATQPIHDFEHPGSDVRSSGIIMKSATDIVAWAGTDFVIGLSNIGGVLGRVVIDAANGDADIYVRARREVHDIAQYRSDRFDDGSCNIFEQAAVRYGTDVSVAGNVYVVDKDDGTGGSVIVRNNIAAGGRLLAGDGVPGIVPDNAATGWNDALMNHAGAVLPVSDPSAQLLTGKTPDAYLDQLSVVSDGLNERSDDTNQLKDEVTEKYYEADDGVCNESFVRIVGFSMRTDEQYYVYDDFGLYEATWQNYARNEGLHDTWEERPVLVPGGSLETYPHPGKQPWVSDKRLYRLKDQYWDSDSGTAGKREEYEPGKSPIIKESSFGDEYIVMVSMEEE